MTNVPPDSGSIPMGEVSVMIMPGEPHDRSGRGLSRWARVPLRR